MIEYLNLENANHDQQIDKYDFSHWPKLQKLEINGTIPIELVRMPDSLKTLYFVYKREQDIRKE